MVHYRHLWRGRRRSTNCPPGTSHSEPLTGTNLSVYSQTHLNKVARQLNERPRKTLAFETPKRLCCVDRLSGSFKADMRPTGEVGGGLGHSAKIVPPAAQ